MKLLSIALALAMGEGLAAANCTLAPLWPAVVVLSVIVSLFGYGLAMRGWSQLFAMLMGAALFLISSVESEHALRSSPWMRNVRLRDRTSERVPPVRREFSRNVGIGLGHDPEIVVLNRAILLGERAKMPPSAKRVFVESGTIHVFAISGMHVMVVAKMLMVFAACCLVPMRFQGLAAIPFVWGYVVMIGLPPSAVRAALMATFYFLAPLFYRRSDGVTAWSLAFLFMHTFTPQYIADVGSQLSFAVMLAIVLASRVMGRHAGTIMSMAATTFAAWAAGLPIAAAVFGRITPGGMMANLLLLPTAAGSVLTGALGALAGFVCEPVAEHLNNLSALLTRLMWLVAELVARLPFANFEIAGWSWWQTVEWYLAMALVFLCLYLRNRRTNMV